MKSSAANIVHVSLVLFSLVLNMGMGYKLKIDKSINRH